MKLEQNKKQKKFNDEKNNYINNLSIKPKMGRDDFEYIFQKCIVNNNFQNLLHIHYPITKDFLQKKLNMEKILNSINLFFHIQQTLILNFG